MKIAICLEDFNPSGGVNFITCYAEGLAANVENEVTLIVRKITAEHSIHTRKNSKIRILTLIEYKNKPESFSLVIATWWGTYDFAFDVDSERYAWFIQSLESRFYETDQATALTANAAVAIDIPHITVAPWIYKYLDFPGRTSKIYSTTNGVDKSIFYFDTGQLEPNTKDPLNVVIEGSNAWFKGIENSVNGISLIDFPINLKWFSITDEFDAPLVEKLRTNNYINLELISGASQTLFSDHLRLTDVLVKSSKVEGMPGPHIEAFHCGATGIYTNVTGIEQFAKHMVNCLISDFDDPKSIAKWLKLLNQDREFLKSLKSSALESSRSWPSQKDSLFEFECAVNDILSQSPILPWRTSRDKFDWVEKVKQVANQLRKHELTQKPPKNLEISATARRYILRMFDGEAIAKRN